MSAITLEQIRSTNEGANRKTKVFCTLGPACWSVEGLGQLIDAGMNIARFNFSHGDHAAHGACLARLREAMAQRPGVPVGVLLDTKGPEIRTGMLDPSCGGKLKLVKGDTIEVGTDYSRPCTPSYLVILVQAKMLEAFNHSCENMKVVLFPITFAPMIFRHARICHCQHLSVPVARC